MSTIARVLANQANAKLSTGPRTPEGKTRSARNATGHGLTGRHLIVLPGERDEFDSFRSEFLEELDPQGAAETLTFDELLHAAWNLRRLRRLETGLATPDHPDPLANSSLDAALDRLDRYRARAQRAYSKALAELRALQTNRALCPLKIAPESEPHIPAIADIHQLTKRSHSEITAAAMEIATRMIDFETSIGLNNCRAADPGPYGKPVGKAAPAAAKPSPAALTKPAAAQLGNPALRL